MRRALTLVAIRTLVLLVLTASAALLYDYTRPLPAFCEAGAGCEAVRASSFAYILGIPQPAIGLLAYLIVFGITLMRHELRRKYLVPLASIGGLLGIVFLAVQAFVIQRFCWLCVIVDTSSVLIAVLAWLHRNANGHDGVVPRFVWSIHALVAILAPMLFGAARPQPPVPPAVARFWVPDKVTIVEMSDFQCPYCRILHPSLTEAIEPYADKIHLVRLSVPLRSHPQAEIAARAYACAKKLGRDEAMAHELFDTNDMSDEGCRVAARRAGLDETAFISCFEGGQGKEAMMHDVELAKAIKFRGLPTLWIGETQLIGARKPDELREVIKAELVGEATKSFTLAHEWMWAMLGLDFLALLMITLLRKPKQIDDVAMG